MKTIFMFPGQGSQIVGMGKDFYDNFEIARRVFEEVNDSLQQNLSDIIFNGPMESLTLTRNTQPALMAVSMAILRVLQEETGKNISQLCDYVAGHSLGEFTALCAAESILLSDTAKLLRIRGSSMQDAVPQGEGGMAAILGMSIDEVNNICNDVKQYGVCQIANDNCPGQIVVSGNIAAIDKIVDLAKSLNKKAVKLAVSAPFHCDLISSVKEIMHQALNETKISEPKIPLICNVTAAQTSDVDEIRSNLVKQVTSMVRWNESIQYLISNKVENFIEIGSGKVLCGLMKRINSDVKSLSINSLADLKIFTS